MMRNLTDSSAPLGEADIAELDALANQSQGPGRFQQGLRAGVPGALSSLNQFAGGAAEALGSSQIAQDVGLRGGLNDFAQGRYQQAGQQAQEARQLSQGIPSWEDVKASDGFGNTLRNAYDFSTGTLGQSVPAMVPSIAAAAATAGGGAVLAPMLAGTAAYAPFATGDQISDLRADPQGAKMDPVDRLGLAGASGVAQSALEQIPLMRIGGKIIGRTAEQAAGKGIAQLAGRGLADVGVQGLEEGAQNAIQQGTTMAVNPDKQFDYKQLEANVAGGVAAGVPMAAPGVVGEAVHGNIKGATDAVKGLAGRAGEAISGAVGSAKTAVQGAGAKIDPDGSKAASVKDAVDDIPDMLEKRFSAASQSAREMLDNIANSSEFANAKAFAGATGDKLKALIDQDNAQRVETVKGYAQELADKALTPEQQDALRTAATDLTDRGNQAVVAGMKRARTAYETIKAKGSKFVNDVNAQIREDDVAKGTKQSADYSGVRKAIVDEIVPILQESNPDLFNDPDAVQQIGEALRKFVGQTKGNEFKLDNGTLESLIDLTGDKTVPVLEAVFRASKIKGPETEKAFYTAMNNITAVQQAHGDVRTVQRKSLAKQFADLPDYVLDDEAKMLRAWANSRSEGKAAGPEKAAFLDSKVRKALALHYGDKADAVYAAVEQSMTKQKLALDTNNSSTKLDEDGNTPEEGGRPPEERAPDTRMILLGARRKVVEGDAQPAPKVGEAAPYSGDQLYLHPDLDKRDDGFDPAATSAMRRAQKKNPGATVRFVGAKELGADHPAVKEMVEQLTKEAMVESRGELTEAQARKQAEKEVANYGMVGAEVSTAETAMTSDELDKLRLNATKFPKSPSRIDTIDAEGKPLILDAVKMVREMNARMTEGSFGGSIGKQSAGVLRDGTMFMESVAAVQASTGVRFDIPDSTVIAFRNDEPLTWGDVQAAVKRYATLRAKEGSVVAISRELGLSTPAEAAAFNKAAGKAKLEMRVEFLQRSKDRELSNEPDSGRTDAAEIDPFGQVHEALGGRRTPTDDQNIRINQTGLSRSDDLTNSRRRPAKSDPRANRGPIARDPGAPPSPKAVAAKKAALLEKARSGDKALIEELSTSNDAKGLQRAAEALVKAKGVDEALDAANDRLRELVGDPDVAYGMLTKRYNLEGVDATANGPVDRKAVLDYINRVLGNSVQVAWADLQYAGDFTRQGGTGNAPIEDIIRLSVHALNPTTVAYHEALHALFAKLGGKGQGDIMEVLNTAASAPGVMNQLRTLLANEPEALKQLNDPEERAAYMYQFWAAGKLKIGEKAQNVFARIAEFIRSVLGVWSNDERALHILDYFHSGEFAKNMGDPSVVHRALMEPGNGKALTAIKRATESFRNLGESLAVAGGQRMRDTGIPALRELADHMKAAGTEATTDAGYLPSARAERSRFMNKLGAALKPYNEAQINEALEALQNGVKPTSTEARDVRKEVKKHLADMFQYMRDAGVNITALKIDDGSTYFPRVYDASYISSHQQDFLNMLEKYKQAGMFKGDPRDTMGKLMTTDGAEFNVEVDRPGMQHSKKRLLDFVSHEDAAPFMRKDLYAIMNGYTTQATRRAEWSRRFNDDGSGISDLLEKAKEQGATNQQLDAAKKYVRAVDGTLGDTIDPANRRLIGNMMVYQNIRLLPLAIFSSVVDPMGIMVRGGTVREAFSAFKRGVRETVNNFKKDAKPDEMTRLAAVLGTIDDTALVHTLGASYSQGMVGDTGRKINDLFFRYNLMEQFNTSMRVGATEAALGFLARHADGTATKHSTRWLAELGLTPADIQLDAEGRPKLTEADGLSPEAAGKMKAAVNRWVDGAVLRPDAADKPIWFSDPHWALISHLKSFVFSFHETIIKRVIHETNAGNYAPAMALASYVPIMIAADMMKGLIQGGGEEPAWKRNWTAGDYVWSGVERAGLLGTGQFVADMATNIHRGGSGIGAALGPTVDQFIQAAQVVGGRGEFGSFLLKSMPANALYGSAFSGDGSEAPAKDAVR